MAVKNAWAFKRVFSFEFIYRYLLKKKVVPVPALKA
jgi:hypothetical protein